MLLVGRTFRDPQQTLGIEALADALHIPSLTLEPILRDLEDNGLLTSNEKDELLPGRETAQIRLNEILNVVRSQGGTGSYREPLWEEHVDRLGKRLDDASMAAVGDLTLVDLIDETEQEPRSASAAGDGHPVDED
jgi:DNA-binding IscR family transcriptional regulator